MQHQPPHRTTATHEHFVYIAPCVCLSMLLLLFLFLFFVQNKVRWFTHIYTCVYCCWQKLCDQTYSHIHIINKRERAQIYNFDNTKCVVSVTLIYLHHIHTYACTCSHPIPYTCLYYIEYRYISHYGTFELVRICIEMRYILWVLIKRSKKNIFDNDKYGN